MHTREVRLAGVRKVFLLRKLLAGKARGLIREEEKGIAVS